MNGFVNDGKRVLTAGPCDWGGICINKGFVVSRVEEGGMRGNGDVDREG